MAIFTKDRRAGLLKNVPTENIIDCIRFRGVPCRYSSKRPKEYYVDLLIEIDSKRQGPSQ